MIRVSAVARCFQQCWAGDRTRRASAIVARRSASDSNFATFARHRPDVLNRTICDSSKCCSIPTRYACRRQVPESVNSRGLRSSPTSSWQRNTFRPNQPRPHATDCSRYGTHPRCSHLPGQSRRAGSNPKVAQRELWERQANVNARSRDSTNRGVARDST